MSNPYLHTMIIPINPPIVMIYAVVFIHFFSFFMPWLTDLSLSIKLSCNVLVVYALWHYLRCHYYCPSEFEIKSLTLNGHDEWLVTTRNGKTFEAILMPNNFVHPWLTIIGFCYGSHKKWLFLTPDVIEHHQFRRLRTRILFPLKIENDNDIS